MYALKVRGLRELLAKTDAADKQTKRLVREGLREAAEPVRREAVRLFTPFDAKSAQNYRVVVRKAGTIRVEQRLRKTTGKHPEFGKLQMREALLPAAESKKDELYANVEGQLREIVRRFG